jgi:amino acid transporter
VSEDQRDPVVSFFGVALLGVGVLVATLSGLCTGIALIISLASGYEGLSIAGMALIVGGVPLLIGLALAWAGRAILRSQRPRPATPEDTP